MIGHYPIEWMASSSDQGRPDVGGHRITEFGPVKRLTMLIAVGASGKSCGIDARIWGSIPGAMKCS